MNTMDYNEAEKMIHRVAMAMSSACNGLIPARADKSHTYLKWDDTKKNLTSKIFIINGGTPLCMSFNPSSFVLSFLDADNDTVGETSTEDFTARELLEWCEDWLFNERSFNGVLHPINTSNDVVWDTVIRRPHDEFLFIWLALRTQANKLLQNLVDITGHKQPVWFKSDTLETLVHFPILQNQGSETCAIEAGLSMSDGTFEKPFYFVRFSANMAHCLLTNPPEIQHASWVDEKWKGAIFQIFDIEKFPATADVSAFMEKAYNFLNYHAYVRS
jgi:hypothetical protein